VLDDSPKRAIAQAKGVIIFCEDDQVIDNNATRSSVLALHDSELRVKTVNELSVTPISVMQCDIKVLYTAHAGIGE
jgi:hypothetical protein